LAVTSIAITDDETFVYSASKDCSIIKWELKTGKKVFTIRGGRKGTAKHFNGHTDHVLGLAVSFDDLFLASSGKDRKICIWDGKTGKFLSSFKQHRSIIPCVAFRNRSHQLYSASHDKMVKLWDIDQMGYVDTLFGHGDEITEIDALSRERCITAGGHDRTVRLWKIVDESQLVFRETTIGSIDCVKFVNDETFISGTTNGTLSLWSINKKKPVYAVSDAHGPDQWIISVAALPYTDLVASGSADGCIRIWKVGEGPPSLSQILSIPINGFVNSLAFSPSGNYLIAGIGQEHRMGRWTKQQHAKNGVYIIPFRKMNKSIE
jgi:ribosomal RNA-processing protein 9